MRKHTGDEKHHRRSMVQNNSLYEHYHNFKVAHKFSSHLAGSN